jgi:hypothetical protein
MCYNDGGSKSTEKIGANTCDVVSHIALSRFRRSGWASLVDRRFRSGARAGAGCADKHEQKTQDPRKGGRYGIMAQTPQAFRTEATYFFEQASPAAGG